MNVIIKDTDPGTGALKLHRVDGFHDSLASGLRYRVLLWRNNDQNDHEDSRICAENATATTKVFFFQKTALNYKRPGAYLAFVALSVVATVETAFYGLMTFLSCLAAPITGRSLVNRCAQLTATNGKVWGRLLVDLLPGTDPVNR